MNKKNLTLSIVSGLLFANSMLAGDCKSEEGKFDIDCIVYIEDESEFELGFDTADYLPEGFDPYKTYFDLDSVVYIEDTLVEELNTEKYLPEGFDAYAFPKDVQSINYIDANDTIELDLDTKKYLPKGFDSFAGK